MLKSTIIRTSVTDMVTVKTRAFQPMSGNPPPSGTGPETGCPSSGPKTRNRAGRGRPGLPGAYTHRAVTVFSSMNMRMEAMRDLAVPTKDSRRDPSGKKA